MRALLPLALLLIAACCAAPQSRIKLQLGSNDLEQQPFIEEVVVESVLNVRAPTARQARTNTRTNLQDGSRVTETKAT